VKFLQIVLFVLGVSCTHQQNAYTYYQYGPELGPDPVYRSVVHLSTRHPDGIASGTGFAVRNVNNNTYFVTVAHLCLARGRRIAGIPIVSISGSREEYEGRVVYSSNKDDMCIVRLYDTRDQFQPVLLAEETPTMGERVYTIGAPGGTFPTKTDGYVVGHDLLGFDPDDSSEPKLRLITSVPAYHGNSGGPVYNNQHQVVGMISATHTRYPHSSISIHVEAIVKHLEVYFKKWERVKKTSS